MRKTGAVRRSSSTRSGNTSRARPYTAQNIRFTTKGGILYATALDRPEDGKLTIKTLAQGSTEYPKPIGQIELLGNSMRTF